MLILITVKNRLTYDGSQLTELSWGLLGEERGFAFTLSASPPLHLLLSSTPLSTSPLLSEVK